MEALKSNITSIVPLKDDEWDIIQNCIEQKTFKKNDSYLKENRVCDSFAFVNKGALIYIRTLDNANEVTIDLAFEGDWATNNYSRINGSPSHFEIKALEDSELFILKNKDLADLYNKIPVLERFGRVLTERAFAELTQLSIDLQTLEAQGRYLKLIKNNPKILQRIPLYHIASYLGIAPKSQSRIRNIIMKEK